MRREHDRSLIDAAEANGGTVVKGLGDGVLVMFAGAAEAVAAGVAMQRAIDLHARNEHLQLAIRVGISAGDVTLEDGDCFGAPVVEASRLCGAADGGHILVAEVVRVLARGRGGHELTPVGDARAQGPHRASAHVRRRVGARRRRRGPSHPHSVRRPGRT